MAVNDAQRKKTSNELIANFEMVGISNAEVQEALGFSAEQLNETLIVGPNSSTDDVRRLRDFLERKMVEEGDDSSPFPRL